MRRVPKLERPPRRHSGTVASVARRGRGSTGRVAGYCDGRAPAPVLKRSVFEPAFRRPAARLFDRRLGGWDHLGKRRHAPSRIGPARWLRPGIASMMRACRWPRPTC